MDSVHYQGGIERERVLTGEPDRAKLKCVNGNMSVSVYVGVCMFLVSLPEGADLQY